jgi:hypothetical protein
MDSTATIGASGEGNESNYPSELRFVRCGRRECWRDANLERQEIHFGWSDIPHSLLLGKDRDKLRDQISNGHLAKSFKSESARRTAVSNSLRELLDALEPERFTWLTIAHNKLWWCTVKTGIEVANASESQGHFFARCERAWSDQSLTGVRLELKTLPKSVSVMSRYQGTLCKPKQDKSIWRAIRGEIDPAVFQFHTARDAYQAALRAMIERLHPSDLEDLVDLLFARGGWSRLAKVGGTEKDWDLQTEHPELDERAAIQVKVEAGQSELGDYEQRYIDDGRFTRLFFVVARPRSKLHPTKAEVWTSEKLAELVERRGLGEWLVGRG